MKKLLAIYVIGLAGMLVGLQSAKAATIAHWTFEEQAPGTAATAPGGVIDVIGGNDGTGTNGPVYVDGYKTGYGNQGLSFNGSNQNVLIPNAPALELSSSFTIEIALETATDNDGGFALFMGGDLGGHDPYYIHVDGAGNLLFQMYMNDGSSFAIGALGALQIGDFQHIAAVFDTTVAGSHEMSLYVDQTQVGSTVNVGSRVAGYDDPTNNLWLGSVNAGQFGFFTGVLADVRISDEPLGPSAFIPVPEPGMIALFGMGLIGLGIARRRRT
jgi:hypothetical protein